MNIKEEMERLKKDYPTMTDAELKKMIRYEGQAQEALNKKKALLKKDDERKLKKKNDDIKRMGKSFHKEFSGMSKYQIKALIERIKNLMDFPEVLEELEKEGRELLKKK